MNPELLLIIVFIFSLLIFGIPAILERSLKGILIAIFASIFGMLGTYLLLFK